MLLQFRENSAHADDELVGKGTGQEFQFVPHSLAPNAKVMQGRYVRPLTGNGGDISIHRRAQAEKGPLLEQFYRSDGSVPTPGRIRSISSSQRRDNPSFPAVQRISPILWWPTRCGPTFMRPSAIRFSPNWIGTGPPNSVRPSNLPHYGLIAKEKTLPARRSAGRVGVRRSGNVGRSSRRARAARSRWQAWPRSRRRNRRASGPGIPGRNSTSRR